MAGLLYTTHTCASTRARSINVLLSAIKPLMAHPEKNIHAEDKKLHDQYTMLLTLVRLSSKLFPIHHMSVNAR